MSVLLLVACGGAASGADAPGAMSVLLLAACGGAASGAATPGPVASATTGSPYTGATRPVTGLFSTPRQTAVAGTRALPAPPPSLFGAWDDTSVVLVDLRTGKRTDLGAGRLGFALSFDPASSKFTWIDVAGGSSGSGVVTVLDLRTGTRRTYGAGSTASFSGNDQLFVQRAGPPFQQIVDLATGDRSPVTLRAGGCFSVWYRDPGVAIERPPMVGTQRYFVVPHDGNPAAVFDAEFVTPDWTHAQTVLAMVRGDGNVHNLFRIDVDTAQATFVASADYPDGLLPVTVGDGAGGSVLVVPDRACRADARLLLYDTRTGRLTAVNTPFVPVMPLSRDELGLDGPTQAARLRVDLASLTYTGVLPAPGAWSPDGNWAAFGPLSVGSAACPASP